MKNYLFALALLWFAFQAQAQFDLGVKAGYSTSKLSTDFDNIKEDIRHNFQFGAFARLGKRLYLQPELYYASSGGSLQLSGTDEKEEIKFQNLCIPLLAGFKIINGEKFNVRIMAGPSANFILSKKFSGDEIVQAIDGADFKTTAWGMDIGAGMDFLFLALDLKYEWGLNDIYTAPVNDQTMKSNVFIVSLGIKIL